MRLIIITPEADVPDEAETIQLLFEAGMHLLHIRKPFFTNRDMEHYLSGIDPVCYSRLVLHDAFEAGLQRGINRFHLNRRNSASPLEKDVKVSRSCHSLEEAALHAKEGYEYLFLSPVFDSISKEGYSAGFSHLSLENAFSEGRITDRTIALGGITPENISQVRRWGFGGVAVLGSVWDRTLSVFQRVEQFNRLKNRCEQ